MDNAGQSRPTSARCPLDTRPPRDGQRVRAHLCGAPHQVCRNRATAVSDPARTARFIEQAQRLQIFFTLPGDTGAANQEPGEPGLSRGWDMTKVLVADDFPLVRDGFAAALVRDPSIKVVGFAEDGVDALEKTRALQPDVLLLDLRMPRMSGLMALTQLTAEMPQVRVLVVSDLERDDTVIDAVAAGAAGFISKHITGAELCEAVHAVKRGEAAISPDLLGHLMRGLRREPSGGLTPTGALTVSELKVLRLVAEGRTDKQISATLYISPRTVQSHLAHIRAKTGI